MFKPLALIRVGICKDCNKTKTNKMIWESVARLFGGVGLILLMGLLGRHADNSGTGVFGAFGLFGLIMSLRGGRVIKLIVARAIRKNIATTEVMTGTLKLEWIVYAPC